MNYFLKILLIVFISCLMINLLREIKKEYSIIISLLCVTLISFQALPYIEVIMEKFSEYSSVLSRNSEEIGIYFKTVGISIICQLACEFCSDTNNKLIRVCVEISGKIAILITSLPLITAVINLIYKYVG